MTMTATEPIPGSELAVDRMPGHWLLARMGKRVLRPGGRELTDQLLDALAIDSTDDVVELAPGLGSTTELVLGRNPATYVGVDRDPVSAERVAHVVNGPGRSVVNASAADTGLPEASADVVFGEAYLTMQPASQKAKIMEELARVVRPGGRIGLHEVCFAPDDLDQERCGAIADDLQRTIKVNVCLLYTSNAADERSSVDLGGRRIIKKTTLQIGNIDRQHIQHTEMLPQSSLT